MRIADCYDAVVVGGGPAGCYAARVIAQCGLRVLVVEKDPRIGVPVRCAEGVGHAGLTEFFDPDPRWIAQRVERFRLVAPSGAYVDLAARQQGFLYVLDRTVFDAHIAALAAEAGAQVVTGATAIGLTGGNGRAVRLLDRGVQRTVGARLIIGADGVESRVGRWAGLKTACSPHDMESCAQVLMTGLDIDPQCACLYFGREVAPGGYAWVFPKGPSSANVGLGISGDFGRERNALSYLDAFVDRHFPKGTPARRTAGGVPCSGGLNHIVADGLMLVGDAAHQANPLSGGGIVNALKAARIAGSVAARALQEGDVSAKRLAEYPREWDRLLGRLHRSFYRIKESVFDLSDERLNRVAERTDALSPDRRTLRRLFTIALKSQPQLLPEIALVFAGQLARTPLTQHATSIRRQSR